MLGLPGLLGQLVQDAIGLARAEIELAKAKAADRIRRSRTAVILLIGALVVAQASIVGLVMGLVMALTPYVGPAGAGAILLAAGLFVAGLLAWIAKRLLFPPAAPVQNATTLEPGVVETGS